MGPRAELEAALQGQSGFSIDTVEMPELRVGNWPIGMAVKAEGNGPGECLVEGAVVRMKNDGTIAGIFCATGSPISPAELVTSGPIRLRRIGSANCRAGRAAWFRKEKRLAIQRYSSQWRCIGSRLPWCSGCSGSAGPCSIFKGPERSAAFSPTNRSACLLSCWS